MDVAPASTDRAGEKPAHKLTPEQKVQVLEAGAAAALDTIAEEEKPDPKAKKKK
jgi:hypothetical protein